MKTDYAILDVQWSPHRSKGREAIAVAASNSLVEFYELKLSPDGKTADLVSSAWLGLFEDEAEAKEPSDLLALSLAWHPTNSRLMVVTLSNGKVHYCTTEGDFAEIDHSMSCSAPEQLTHDLEAWTAAFSPTSTGVFSGGDDCALRLLKPHWGSDGMDGVEASWQDKRLHGAGVTAILPLSDGLVVTGSYDDRVRLIAAHAVGRRRVLAERNLEGGVWRLKVIEADELPDEGDDADRFALPTSLSTLVLDAVITIPLPFPPSMTPADELTQSHLHLHHPRELHARRRARAATPQGRRRGLALRGDGPVHGAREHELRR